MSPATEALPHYLKKYIAVQSYDAYTARDHAVWRFIMRQNRAFFSTYAAPVYLDGLKKTGIPIDRIPRVSEMDECLAQFGWGAVAVQGFIPPAAFLDFQARGVLPIASDMRTVEHIAYTPAPDIVHEAAGHAPILADPAYANYLKRYARLAQKAISSKYDIRLYEAIRYLSDIKENPDTDPQEILAAELRLKDLSALDEPVSESASVARMNWWTVEYGLVGSLAHPKIYGAGLLSSVGESQSCLSEKVKKIPLSLECIQTAYDITEPQPQLFVVPKLERLIDILEELEQTMSYIRGGIHGLTQAQGSGSVTTTQLDSGIEISGVLDTFLLHNSDVTFLRWTGPVQLSVGQREMSGHGTMRHAQGFSSPIGAWKTPGNKPKHLLHNSELESLGLRFGQKSQIDFASGITVAGDLLSATRTDGKLQLLTWKNCTVRRGSEIFFEPAWGEFDLVIGETITSVFGGPSDAAAYGEYTVGNATSTPGRKSPFRAEELELFNAYRWLRQARTDAPSADPRAIDSMAIKLVQGDSSEWLLAVELIELCALKKFSPRWEKDLRRHLGKISMRSEESVSNLIAKGLALANQS